MTNTLNVGNAEQNGWERLNPRQIASKLIPVAGAPPVRILDATDEQFEAFIKQVGIPVKAGGEGQRWSFDNRCRAINYALKYRLHLPFVDANNSVPNKNNSPSELLLHPEPQTVIAIPQERVDLAHVVAIVQAQPNITDNELADKLGFRRPASARFWRLKAFEALGWLTRDEHPLEPVVPTGGRDYPDLEEGE